MSYNKYNLRQLLQLALRVPEVGAVNFNILYYILKTIIEQEGLEEVKPVFSLDLVTDPSTELSITRPCSAESLLCAKGGWKEKYDVYDEEFHNESLKWDKIKVFKRLDGIEEEIGSIHDVLAKLDGKVSNLEKGFVIQETKFSNEFADFRQMMKSKLELKEYNVLSKKVEDVVHTVSELMNMREEMSGLRQKCEEIATKIGDIAEEVIQIQHERSIEIESKFSEDILPEISSDEPETKPEKPEKVTVKDIKKTSHLREKEQEILSKIEALNAEIIYIKEHLKSPIPVDVQAEKKDLVGRVIDLEDAQSKQEKIIEKMDLQLLDLYKELNKLMEKCNVLDETLSHDINQIKDKSFQLEHTSNLHSEELEGMTIVMDGIVYNFDTMKENLKYMEKQIAQITELPGIKNRVDQLEEYVYSGSDQSSPSAVDKRAAEDSMKAKQRLKFKKELKTFKSTSEKTEKRKERRIEELVMSDSDAETEDHKPQHFHVISKSVRLMQDMQKKEIPRLPEDIYKSADIKDENYEDRKLYTSQKLEDFTASDFEELKEVPSHPIVSKADSHEKVKSTTFMSPGLHKEYSLQLKKELILYIEKKLCGFETPLQIVQKTITNTKDKTDSLEKYCKELGEKIAFMQANFSQRAGDLAALKNTADTHQASIVSIMHHLERKAEAYAVNQKVSRRELTVIEDRVLKLCKTTSSGISKLEEKIDDSFEKFSSELDKKLFIEEFEIHLDSLKHKLKVFDIKLKDLSIKPPVEYFDDIRPPVEIKKYVLCKDEIKIKRSRTITSGKTRSSPDHFLPLLCQHLGNREVSPKTATQLQKELQLASSRESKRYVEGAYTKIKVGRR